MTTEEAEFRREVLAELEGLRAEMGRMKRAMEEMRIEVQALRRELDAVRSGDAAAAPDDVPRKRLH